MLPALFRRAAFLPAFATLISIRSASAMASPPSSFALDRGIFNQTLYTRMRDFWLGDLPADAVSPSLDAAKKWFGVGKSDEEKEAFDGECRQNFVHALEAIAPEKLALPKFESYEKEIEGAEQIASPFLTEVKAAQAEGEKHGAEIMLALILLLDQMSRNIYRDPEGLRKVYLHYDRLAFTLVHASMRSLPPSPIDLRFIRLRPTFRNWLIMPLLHSEHLPSHDLWSEKVNESREEIKKSGDPRALDFLEKGEESEAKHVDLLRRFGRYPHRNECLGRSTTEAEKEYLKDGDTFGVKTSQTKEGKSEL